MTIVVGMWKRIGVDGLPPLARDLTVHGDPLPFARIVDVTLYDDLPPTVPQTAAPEFVIEWFDHDWVEIEPTFSTFDDALAYAGALYRLEMAAPPADDD